MQLLLFWIVSLRDPVVPDELLHLFGQHDLKFEEKVLLLGSEPFELINYLLNFFKQVELLIEPIIRRKQIKYGDFKALCVFDKLSITIGNNITSTEKNK